MKIGLFWEVLREGFRDFDGSGGFWGSWSFGDFGGSWGHGVEGYVFFGIKKLIYINISTFTSVLPASSVVVPSRRVPLCPLAYRPVAFCPDFRVSCSTGTSLVIDKLKYFIAQLLRENRKKN